MGRWGHCWRRRAEAGSVAIEFALIMPVLVVLIFAVLEVGCLFFAQFVLKNAAVATARHIRTGNGSALTSRDLLANYICNTSDSTIDKLAANVMLSGCSSGLKIYVKTMGTGFSYSALTTALSGSAVKSDGTIPANFDASLSGACQVVLLRVSYEWKIVVPGLTWFLVTVPGTNKSIITATEVFRNEPAEGSATSC